MTVQCIGLSRIYACRNIRTRLIKKIVTLKRLKMVKEKFAKYGNRVYLWHVLRFKGTNYMISGITRRVSFIRFLLIDFCCNYFGAYLGIFG